MRCPHDKIESALDRWVECHWHIHQMELHYHEPDPFRYSLNSFIRAVKEIPQILKMELQNDDQFKSTYKPIIDKLKNNPLMFKLSGRRDFIVHRGMLAMASTGHVGTTEGRGIKIAIQFPVYPHESTDEAYVRYKEYCKVESDFRGLSGPDCDSWPMIRREWMIPEFPDTELLQLAIDAWTLSGETLSAIVEALGAEPLDLSFSCRHEPERVKTKEYSQEEYFRDVDGIEINA